MLIDQFGDDVISPERIDNDDEELEVDVRDTERVDEGTDEVGGGEDK